MGQTHTFCTPFRLLLTCRAIQISMNSQHPHGGSGAAPYDRERELDDRHRASYQHEEMARREQQEREREREQRDRERDREREGGDRYQQQTTPRHSSAGSIPIHQPVASRISGAIHSPGGLLAKHNGNAPPVGLGGASGSVASFGGPLPQQNDQHSRQVQHPVQGSAGSHHQMFAPLSQSQPPAAAASATVFGGPLQQQQPQQPPQQQPAPPSQQQQQDAHRGGQQSSVPFPGAATTAHQVPGGMTQGQQPILNVGVTSFSLN